jgi:hypothetical protein
MKVSRREEDIRHISFITTSYGLGGWGKDQTQMERCCTATSLKERCNALKLEAWREWREWRQWREIEENF